MVRNRWLTAVLAATTLAAGCAGGSTTGAPPLTQPATAPAAAQPSQRFSTTSAPTEAIKKMDDAIGSTSQTPTWQFLEPLYISDNGTFSPAQKSSNCSPIDPIFGIWYLSLRSFTLPMSNVSLPECSISTASSGPGWIFSKNRSAATPATSQNNNLYIVELSVGLFSQTVTPIAGPVTTSGSTWYFAPLEKNLSFSKNTLYSFFVAAYNGPQLAQPSVACEAGSTSCSLGSAPTPGNRLVAIVSDGSGQLANLVVTDSAGNALTREAISPNCGHCVAVYDETVSSGNTGAVTYSSGKVPYYPNVSAVYELANVTSGQFASANTAGIPTSLASTISQVTNNDVQLCAYIQTGTSNITLTFSNGSPAAYSYDYQSTGAVFAHENANANGSSSCTANNINAAYEAAMVYADYP